MKKTTIFMLLISFCAFAKAQKKLIDTSAYASWPSYYGYVLSPDGAYAFNTFKNMPSPGYSTLVVKAVHGKWIQTFTDKASAVFFSGDSRYLVFLNGKNELCLLALGGGIKTIPNVSYCEAPHAGRSLWLIYQLKDEGAPLMLYNLKNGQEQSLGQVTSYRFNPNGTALLMQKKINANQLDLQWLDLESKQVTTLWKGMNNKNITFNATGNALAFTGQDSTHSPQQVWYYRSGEAKAAPLKMANGNLEASHIKTFDGTGERLFYSVTKTVSKPTSNPNYSAVDLYSYKDSLLQSIQLQRELRTEFTCVYNFLDQNTIQLERENEQIQSKLDGDWLLIRRSGGGNTHVEWIWNKKALVSIDLVSTNTGVRKCLCLDKAESIGSSYQLSPSGKYVIYYDPFKKSWFSYSIAAGYSKNITKGLKVDWRTDRDDEPASSYYYNGIAGWSKDENDVLFYSRYDIIRASSDGNKPAVDLTRGYGVRHHITFANAFGINRPMMYDQNKITLLSYTNEKNRDEGFCQIVPGSRSNLEILSARSQHLRTPPYKAYDAEVYEVDWTSAENYLESYTTTDFKTFLPLTNFKPAKNYNWLKTELLTWTTLDGKNTQGVLYKPENFNPKKKYPVIFFYYEKMSQNIHKPLVPQYSDAAEIDIATYVSNGYLVCTPDIHYKIGYPGRSAYNSIVSAANYLSRFPWVDKSKMGLMGHSFGGFETNYVITHSHLFAAAVSMSGMTDFISAYGSIIAIGSRQAQYELYRDRIGATLWQRPDLYIENSPVFRANQVTTPVLLMANTPDDDVPYTQGIEFFTALRRLQKKAWLLHYDKGGHQLGLEADKKDVTQRMRQFFDYYLKGLPPPKWMTEGIPANMKQVDNGFELDISGKKPE